MEILLKIKKIIINLLNIIIIIYITENYLFTQSLEKDFTGVDRIFMVSSIGEKECSKTKSHLNLVEAVKKCEIKLIINLGYLNYQNNTNKLADDHKYSEKILEESGLNYSIARNATYMNRFMNSNGELFKYLMKKENNFFYNTCKDLKICFRLIRELGEVRACILLMKFPKKYMNYLVNLFIILILKML